MNGLSIEYLADHRDLVRTIAEWHWLDEDGRMPLDFWIEAHSREAIGREVPTAWVALLGSRPVGCVSLIESNMDTHPGLAPWLAALFVVEEARGRGIGASLTRHCEDRAAALGFPMLYLYTETAERFYSRLGWSVQVVDEYEDERVSVMQKSLTAL
jgi:GNAT superfamily N-acetyltransferase